MLFFIAQLMTSHSYSCAEWDGFCYHLRDLPWENIFKLGPSTAVTEFWEWIQVGIDAYIPFTAA